MNFRAIAGNQNRLVEKIFQNRVRFKIYLLISYFVSPTDELPASRKDFLFRFVKISFVSVKSVRERFGAGDVGIDVENGHILPQSSQRTQREGKIKILRDFCVLCGSNYSL